MSRDAYLAWLSDPTWQKEHRWVCEVCGKTLIATSQDAFEAGWDTPPNFTGYIKCESCPITGTWWYKLVFSAKNRDADG